MNYIVKELFWEETDQISFCFRRDTEDMFKSAFEFVETYDTTLSRKMTGLKPDRAKCEFKFCHLGTLAIYGANASSPCWLWLLKDNVCKAPAALSSEMFSKY